LAQQINNWLLCAFSSRVSKAFCRKFTEAQSLVQLTHQF